VMKRKPGTKKGPRENFPYLLEPSKLNSTDDIMFLHLFIV